MLDLFKWNNQVLVRQTFLEIRNMERVMNSTEFLSVLAILNFTLADCRSTLSPIECLEWCSLDARMIAVIVGEFDQRHSVHTDNLLQIQLSQLLNTIRLFHRQKEFQAVEVDRMAFGVQLLPWHRVCTADEDQSKTYLSQSKTCNEHYALWEVIEFGDSYKAPQEEAESESSAKKKGRTVVITTEDMPKRRNDTFGGNEATKKTKKNQLKQQYGNFKAEGSETLEQTFNSLQAIRNRDDLDTMSLDDVYNHLKVYEPEVQKKSELNSQNMAFISSANTSSGKAASISHDIVCAYIASQSNGSQIKYEDITQIDENDIEEIDIKECRALRSQDRGRRESYKQGSKEEEPAPKALMAIDGIGWDWSYMANEEENHALVADDEASTEFALMSKSSSSFENEVYDDSFCSKFCRKNTYSLNTKINKLNEELSDSENTLYHYKLGLSQVEARLVEFKTQEIKFCEKIRGLEIDVEFKNNKIEYLMNKLEQVKKEKEGLDRKLTCFESALKDLDTLLGSQRTDKNKEGLGYIAVPPSAQVYSPPKKDMSWTGLPEFTDHTITDYCRPSPSIESNTSDLQNSNSSVFEHRESSSSIMSKRII
nr:hypothetical protein [Tanacetum cinerariifolium]